MDSAQPPESAPSYDTNISEEVKKKKTFPGKKLIILFVLVVIIAIVVAVIYVVTRNDVNVDQKENNETQEETKKLVYLVHWTWEDQLGGLQKYLDEYTALHPEITFEVKVVSYSEYPDKLELFHDTDTVPDIYQIYSSWGVDLVEKGILASPPQDIVEDVEENYLSTAGVLINDQVWGIPSEINDYCLVYDKELFKKEGLLDSNGDVMYPKSWSELSSMAKQLTKTDAKGDITQYGIVFGQGEDWGVVDPFLSLLFSNEGEYLSSDFSEALINSEQSIEALESLDALYEDGVTSVEGNIFDFGKGKIAMVIAPPWLEATFKESFGDRYETDIGVAPLPKLKRQTSLQYSWFVGVMEKSKYKQESWDFLEWFTSEIQPDTNTTRYGDLLANVIGAIPARVVDLENHDGALQSVFKKTYVEELANSTPEPNILSSSRVKKILMDEISAVWVDKKTATEALNDAKVEIDKILELYYPVE